MAALRVGLLGIGLSAAFGTPAGAASAGFTYMLPAGWLALDLKSAPSTLRTAASPAGDDAATFTVQDVSSALPPDRYVQKLLAGLKAASPQTHIFSRGTFVPASGLRGYRTVFDETAPGGSVHFVVCVFPGPGRRRLLIAGLWPASDTTKYDVAVNQSLKTFEWK